MAEIRIINQTANIGGLLVPALIPGTLVGNEALAHKFVITAVKNGAPVALSGAVSGVCLRYADGGSVALTGDIEDGMAAVTLPAACYALDGRVRITIYVTADSATVALWSCDTHVRLAETGTAVDPGTVIPSVAQLVTAIEEAVESIPMDYSALDNYTKGIGNMQAGQTDVGGAFTLGRIDKSESAGGPEASTKYAYSEVFARTGAALYWDDTVYTVMACYYDSASANPGTTVREAVNGWYTESPQVMPGNSHPYIAIEFKRLDGGDITAADCALYTLVKSANVLKIEELDERVDVLENGVPAITLTDISDTTAYPRYSGGIVKGGTVFDSTSGTHKYIVVPARGGDVVEMTACTGSTTNTLLYACAKSIPTPPTAANTPIDMSAYKGWETVKAVQSGQSITEILPPDAACLIIQVQRSSTDWTPTAFYLGAPKTVRWMAMGDSITQGTYSFPGSGDESAENNSTYNGCYAAWVAALKGFDLTNWGVGGTGWMKRGGGSSSRKLNAIEQIFHRKGTYNGNALDVIDFTGQYTSVPYVIDFSGIDLLTVMFGVNDWKGSISDSLPIHHGTIDSVTEPDANYNVAYPTGKENDLLAAYNYSFYDGSGIGFTETVYGNMKLFLEEAQSRNPSMKIVVLSPVNSAVYPSSALGGGASTPPSTAANQYGIGFKYYNGKTLEDMCELEKNVCELYGVQFVDLLHSSCVNLLNIGTALPDKVHPSLETHQQLAREIAAKIQYD